MASGLPVSFPSLCSTSRVKPKIQMLILLKFNTTGLALHSLETEYLTYFKEPLDMKVLGNSSTLDLVKTMRSEVEISQVDRNWIIKAVPLSHERTVNVLAKIFPSESDSESKSKGVSGFQLETKGKGGKSKVKVAEDGKGQGKNFFAKTVSLGHEKTVKILSTFFASKSKPDAGVEQERKEQGGKNKVNLVEDGSKCDGSGSSDPSSTTLGFAQNIKINSKDLLAACGFGKVYRGNWDGTQVAVKIFCSGNDRSLAAWKREVEIYKAMTFQLDHTVGFLGSEIVSSCRVQYWIVTKFYPLGSLQNFLERNTLSLFNLVKLSYCLANGLSFLHLYSQDDRIRNGVVHGDIKSTNILVEQDFTCVLTDFGSSIVLDRATGNLERSEKIATPRYMAPEILEQKSGREPFTFDDYKKMDIYSVALVIWEMLSRTEVETKPTADSDSASASASTSNPEPHKLPYFESIPERNPTEEAVRKVVCGETSCRPSIPSHCSSNNNTKFIWDVVEQAWDITSSKRPSSGLIRLKMIELFAMNSDKEGFNSIGFGGFYASK